jgi:hypothetical protein
VIWYRPDEYHLTAGTHTVARYSNDGKFTYIAWKRKGRTWEILGVFTDSRTARARCEEDSQE